MSFHETRSVTEILVWCPTCGKNTMHRVDDRRVGPCLNDHVAGMSKDQERRKKKMEHEEQNPKLRF